MQTTTTTPAPKARLIALEGIRVVGADAISKVLRESGIECVVQTTNIMDLILDEGGLSADRRITDPRTLLLRAFADLNETYHRVIAPSLSSGKWVILERYIDTLYALIRGGFMLPLEDLEAIDSLVYLPLPDLSVVMDLSPQSESQNSVLKGVSASSYQGLDDFFWERVRLTYIDRIRDDSSRFTVVEQTLSDLSSGRACPGDFKHLLEHRALGLNATQKWSMSGKLSSSLKRMFGMGNVDTACQLR